MGARDPVASSLVRSVGGGEVGEVVGGRVKERKVIRGPAARQVRASPVRFRMQMRSGATAAARRAVAEIRAVGGVVGAGVDDRGVVGGAGAAGRAMAGLVVTGAVAVMVGKRVGQRVEGGDGPGIG